MSAAPRHNVPRGCAILFRMRRTLTVLSVALFCIPAIASASSCPTLSQGATGPAVITLQKFLNYEYANFPAPTCYFRMLTKEEVQHGQYAPNIFRASTPGTTG